MPRPALYLTNLLLALLLLAAPVTAAVAAQPTADQLLVHIGLPDASDAMRTLANAPLTLLAVESLPRPYGLALVDASGLAWLKEGGYRVEVLDEQAADARYLMVDLAGALADRERPGIEIYNDGVRAVRRLEPGQRAQLDKGAWLLDLPLRWIERQPLRLPASVTPIAQVQQLIGQVNLPRLMAYTNELSGEVPATIMGQPFTIVTRYSPGNPPPQASIMAGTYMLERLARLGLTVSTQTWNSSRPPNVIAEKPGLDPTAGIVIICAHLDNTSSSPSTLAPGADDNGSGSVAVLRAAELLTPYNFDATLRFVLFTGEEQGLYGSAYYAQTVQNQDIRGVLNMDMIAWDNSGGPDMDIHSRSTVPGNTALANLYADVVSAYEIPLTPVVYGNGTSASDHASFWSYNIPAILAIENYNADVGAPRDFNAYYHTVNDRAQVFNQNYFLAMTQASLATFVHMAGLRTTCFWADLDCSGQVDTMDLTRVATAWQTQSGQWNYSLVYDVDSSGDVDVVDIQSFAAEWGWDGS
ncbi:MAG TPA: M28 family metallopeptidase [Anaerolineae bacterium]|nr:M28 family metallopeptidase [Anaerolineae bacterium]